jgi:4-amino-4-deoxy-L-arabinose transferase-like glycosyltransferase
MIEMPRPPESSLPMHGQAKASAPAVWWLVAVVLAVWFLTLNIRHLLPSDEGRYAEIAREMFASGDWVTIRYNGLKYFEKPPFHLWMTALAYQAFGIGDWQARLWVAISGAAGLLLTMWAARRWYGDRVSWFTGLALLAAPTWNIGSHFNSLDMGVSGALAGVLAGFLLAQHPQASLQSRRRWMLFAWGAMALAVLTKGLIGLVLPGLVLVVYSLVARDWVLWRRLHIVSGTILFLLLTAPWFWLISTRNPEFAQFFFIHEHWQRYTSSVHQRSAPWWYFGPQLIAGFLPWLGLTPRICALLRNSGQAREFRPELLLAVWAGAILVFFSLSGSKLPGYILPVFPALALLAALALDRIDAKAWQRQLLGMLLLAGCGLLATLLLQRSDDYGLWLGAACLVILLGLLLAWRCNRRGQPGLSITLFALAWFAGTTVGLAGHQTLGRSNSGVDLVPAIQAVLTPQMPIYSVRRLDHTLPFYLRRTMIMVEAPDELAFGVEQEPQKWLPTLAAFSAAWTTGPPALALMSRDSYQQLKAQGLPIFDLTGDEKRLVVTNFPGKSP